MTTYEAVLSKVSSQAIVEAAMRYASGEVSGQSRTFAPSVADFVQESKRIDELIPYRGRLQLPAGDGRPHVEISEAERVRMGFKMSLLSFSLGCGQVDRVAEANSKGWDYLIALGQEWHIPVPEALFRQLKGRAA